jgi:hypothetical protein
MIVAIHQPNYLPWLGYFAKIARADVFVFLDDVQYTKGGYTNRVQILAEAGPRWLTVPVGAHLGDAIRAVRPSRPDWARAHADCLRNTYRTAAHFQATWPELRDLLLAAPYPDLAEGNAWLIVALCQRLGLSCAFRRSSEFAAQGTADERLVELVRAVDPAGAYLSGRGGAKYQDPAKFAAAGLGFSYLEFSLPEYPQHVLPPSGFTPGLSLVDAILNLGWEGAARLLLPA